MKSHSFNLIELSLFLVFLTLLSSVLTLNLPKVLFWQRANHEIYALEGLIQAVNDWVLFSEADLKLNFSFSQDKLFLKISSAAKDLTLPFSEKTAFSTFESIDFIDANQPLKRKTIYPSTSFSSFDVGLSDNGGLQPPLYLSFKQKKRTSTTYFFPGHPHVFQAKK